jgi:hypothetical protein
MRLYHGPLKSQSEHKLADLFEAERAAAASAR